MNIAVVITAPVYFPVNQDIHGSHSVLCRIQYTQLLNGAYLNAGMEDV